MKPETIEKIAFLVHEPVLWTHYANVWEKLGNEKFSIVLTNRFQAPPGTPSNHGATAFLDNAKAANYEIVWAEDLLRRGQKYRYVVSNHKIGGSRRRPAPIPIRLLSAAKRYAQRIYARTGHNDFFVTNEFSPWQYWPLQIGETQIRFMYGADIGDGWSLAPWNEMYDAFLCHGPNDEAQLAKRFSGQTFQMGYPRYDNYYSASLDVSAEIREFSIHSDRQTILWMPTFGVGACSIPYFAEVMAPLRSDYNLIVRPHPLSFRENPKDIDLLRSLKFCIDENPVRDMNKLYRIVDTVLCDYGGSAFGAMYLDKRMVLLDVPHASDWYTVQNSSNLELSKYYPSLGVNDIWKLADLLKDETYWETQRNRAIQLAGKYFSDYRGTSSERAADILLNIQHLMNAPIES